MGSVWVVLQLLTLEHALEMLQREILPIEESEWVETSDALGRILAEEVRAGDDLPPWPRSTVDGFAVRARDTHGASESSPVYLRMGPEVAVDDAPGGRLLPGEAWPVATGSVVPDGADAVVMLEWTSVHGQVVEMVRPVAQGENIIGAGEDVPAGSVLVPRGRRLRAPDLGVLAAAGITRVKVLRRPRVAVLSTGDELVSPEVRDLPRGRVRDANGIMTAARLRQEGCHVVGPRLLPDDPQVIGQALDEARRLDAVYVSGGTSAGSRDLVPHCLSGLSGVRVLAHGLALKPGKPTLLAVWEGRPVVGLPGHPLSAGLVMELVGVPAIRLRMGLDGGRRPTGITACLASEVSNTSGRMLCVPCRLRAAGDGWLAEPLWSKSAAIGTLAVADGWFVVPAETVGLAAGSLVTVLPLAGGVRVLD